MTWKYIQVTYRLEELCGVTYAHHQYVHHLFHWKDEYHIQESLGQYDIGSPIQTQHGADEIVRYMQYRTYAIMRLRSFCIILFLYSTGYLCIDSSLWPMRLLWIAECGCVSDWPSSARRIDIYNIYIYIYIYIYIRRHYVRITSSTFQRRGVVARVC